MGISLLYRRITRDKLRDLRASQIEELLDAYMYSDRAVFPGNAVPEEDVQHLDLDKLYPLIDGFLNPEHQKTSIFFHALHHGKPVIDDPAHEHGDSLGVISFLTPDQVKAITQAMNAIAEDEWIDRYRLLMGDERNDEARARSESPTYDDVINLFADFRHFFQQATDSGDGILRCYC